MSRSSDSSDDTGRSGLDVGLSVSEHEFIVQFKKNHEKLNNEITTFSFLFLFFQFRSVMCVRFYSTFDFHFLHDGRQGRAVSKLQSQVNPNIDETIIFFYNITTFNQNHDRTKTIFVIIVKAMRSLVVIGSDDLKFKANEVSYLPTKYIIVNITWGHLSSPIMLRAT